MTDKLLTAKEAAARLRCSYITVLRWIKSKKIRAARAGRGRLPYLIKESDVDQLVREMFGEGA